MAKITYNSIENGRQKTIFFNEDKPCIDCGNKLNKSNWSLWRIKKRHYICSHCFNKRLRTSDSYKSKRKTKIIKKQFDKNLSLKITNFIKDSRIRGIAFSLSYSEVGLIMLKDCFYCGIKSEKNKRNSIDRVDSSKNYDHDNVVPCCRSCNVGKGAMTVIEYINHCKNVYLRNGGTK